MYRIIIETWKPDENARRTEKPLGYNWRAFGRWVLFIIVRGAVLNIFFSLKHLREVIQSLYITEDVYFVNETRIC